MCATNSDNWYCNWVTYSNTFLNSYWSVVE